MSQLEAMLRSELSRQIDRLKELRGAHEQKMAEARAAATQRDAVIAYRDDIKAALVALGFEQEKAA